jgi:hypothetical protein
MESANRQHGEQMKEQKVSSAGQLRRAREITPGLNGSDFGKPGEGGESDYYAQNDSPGKRASGAARDEIREGNRGGGADEGLTGFGPGGASDAQAEENIEEIERRGNA